MSRLHVLPFRRWLGGTFSHADNLPEKDSIRNPENSLSSPQFAKLQKRSIYRAKGCIIRGR
ncbi:hypothetical protein SCLCIDRAFT_1210486 [Scleroderma citrinum Foug A]|uniref:Uncharacterized protein n=1 Tax=Scleroderma citrinum Foug A TaxID=1036808 RepID=A0A0C3A043_9AGAM|nr:hypothetical protein SCLCIDRAFT_1210486 [Scleroderma citrinum Foug A]